jgi:PPOX class probable F420-dependent enzyme
MSKLRFPVLATLNPDGTIQQSVMWFDLEGDQVLMNTKVGRSKHRNMRSNDVVSLCFEDEGTYVTLSGRVMVVDDLDRGQADIYRLAVRYEGEDSARKQVQSDYSHQQRTSLLVTIDKVFTHGLKQDAGE